MCAKPRDITGQRFGKLIAIERTSKDSDGSYIWKCRCDCGNEKFTSLCDLSSGHVKSCGCLRKKPPITIKHGRTKHGGKREKLYNVWVSMKQRCYNEKNRNYFRYGGRGIKVCEEWQHDYEAFRDWCYKNGYDYGNGLELDREDNNGDYTPDNCRFVTHRENLLNTHRAKKYREAKDADKVYYISKSDHEKKSQPDRHD